MRWNWILVFSSCFWFREGGIRSYICVWGNIKKHFFLWACKAWWTKEHRPGYSWRCSPWKVRYLPSHPWLQHPPLLATCLSSGMGISDQAAEEQNTPFCFYAAFVRPRGEQATPELTGCPAAHSLQTAPGDAAPAEFPVTQSFAGHVTAGLWYHIMLRSFDLSLRAEIASPCPCPMHSVTGEE